MVKPDRQHDRLGQPPPLGELLAEQRVIGSEVLVLDRTEAGVRRLRLVGNGGQALGHNVLQSELADVVQQSGRPGELRIDAGGGLRNPLGAAGDRQTVQDEILAGGRIELLVGEVDLETGRNLDSQQRIANLVGIQAVQNEANRMTLTYRSGGLTLRQRENHRGAGGLAFERLCDRGRREAALGELREILHGDAWRDRQRSQLVDGQFHLAGRRRIDVPFRHAATLCYLRLRGCARHRWRRSPSLQLESHVTAVPRRRVLTQPTATRNSPCR